MSGLLTRSSHHPTRMILALIAGATVLAAAALHPIQAHAGELMVKYDQSQLLHLPRPVAEIIIGNPTIADVSVQSKMLLVVTGKSFGKTNLILLDSERNVIQENQIVVRQDYSQVVNLLRGADRQSYNCTPRCNPTVTIGDEKQYFATAAANARMKLNMSESASSSSGGGR